MEDNWATTVFTKKAQGHDTQRPSTSRRSAVRLACSSADQWQSGHNSKAVHAEPSLYHYLLSVCTFYAQAPSWFYLMLHFMPKPPLGFSCGCGCAAIGGANCGLWRALGAPVGLPAAQAAACACWSGCTCGCPDWAGKMGCGRQCAGIERQRALQIIGGEDGGGARRIGPDLSNSGQKLGRYVVHFVRARHPSCRYGAPLPRSADPML